MSQRAVTVLLPSALFGDKEQSLYFRDLWKKDFSQLLYLCVRGTNTWISASAPNGHSYMFINALLLLRINTAKDGKLRQLSFEQRNNEKYEP